MAALNIISKTDAEMCMPSIPGNAKTNHSLITPIYTMTRIKYAPFVVHASLESMESFALERPVIRMKTALCTLLKVFQEKISNTKTIASPPINHQARAFALTSNCLFLQIITSQARECSRRAHYAKSIKIALKNSASMACAAK